MSQSGTQSELPNIAARSPHPEPYVRRGGSAEALPERLGNRGHIDPAKLPRRYARPVPSASISQGLLDLFLIGGGQLAVMELIYERLDLDGRLEALAVIAVCALASIMFLYATGCY